MLIILEKEAGDLTDHSYLSGISNFLLFAFVNPTFKFEVLNLCIYWCELVLELFGFNVCILDYLIVSYFH